MRSKRKKSAHSLFRNGDAVRMLSSGLGEHVRVSHNVHLFPVQVGNARVKEGNTHVNGEEEAREAGGAGGDGKRPRRLLREI